MFMFSENKVSKILKEKATVFPKVQTVLNHVFATSGLNKNQTLELSSIVEEDNVDGCDEFFWYAPNGNADETKFLLEMTSWKTKGRYVVESLKEVNSSYEKGSLSGTKNVPTDTSSEW